MESTFFRQYVDNLRICKEDPPLPLVEVDYSEHQKTHSEALLQTLDNDPEKLTSILQDVSKNPQVHFLVVGDHGLFRNLESVFSRQGPWCCLCEACRDGGKYFMRPVAL